MHTGIISPKKKAIPSNDSHHALLVPYGFFLIVRGQINALGPRAFADGTRTLAGRACAFGCIAATTTVGISILRRGLRICTLSSGLRGLLISVLSAVVAGTGSGSTGALASIGTAVAWMTLVFVLISDIEPSLTLSLATTNKVNVLLSALKVGQVTSLVVYVKNLLVALLVECPQLLTSRGANSLLEVRVQAAPTGGSLLGHAILGVNSLCLLGRLVLAIEVVESRHETIADAVLVVKSNGLSDGLVADDVTVSEVFSDDARARLVLLCNVISSRFIGRAGSVGTGDLVKCSCRGNMDLSGTELRVVKQKGRLCSSLFLECDCG